jgi:hypothetical protein
MTQKKPDKKAKLPKQVLGVKIPKELRKAGGALLEHANSPAGREVIAAGLTVAAAAATAALTRHRTPPTDAGAGDGSGTTRPSEPQAFADAIGQVAETALSRLFGAR